MGVCPPCSSRPKKNGRCDQRSWFLVDEKEKTYPSPFDPLSQSGSARSGIIYRRLVTEEFLIRQFG
jgi:hypothetical protein